MDKTIKTNDLNSNAVKAMWIEGNKNESSEINMKNCEKILNNAFDEAEKELGRSMTYAEMRERFG